MCPYTHTHTSGGPTWGSVIGGKHGQVTGMMNGMADGWMDGPVDRLTDSREPPGGGYLAGQGCLESDGWDTEDREGPGGWGKEGSQDG